MNPAPDNAVARNRWAEAWPDALAFVLGLGSAWWFHWQTRDLVWSLWLSSFVIGYAMIVWSIFGPGVQLALIAWQKRREISAMPTWQVGAGAGVLLIGGLFMLAFFTVHFGGFHVVHSMFLSAFFPLMNENRGVPGLALYLEVLSRYWWFLPMAAIAERAAFRLPVAGPPDTSVKAADIEARKARNSGLKLSGEGMTAPYRNVVRMHLLIFFFAFAHFANLENFWVYAVVYAVYFFPWRLLKRAPQAGLSTNS